MLRELHFDPNTTIRACICSIRTVSSSFANNSHPVTSYHFSVIFLSFLCPSCRRRNGSILQAHQAKDFFTPRFRVSRASFVRFFERSINLSEIPSRRSARKFRESRGESTTFPELCEERQTRRNNVRSLVFPCAAVRMKMLLLNQSFRE